MICLCYRWTVKLVVGVVGMKGSTVISWTSTKSLLGVSDLANKRKHGMRFYTIPGILGQSDIEECERFTIMT